VPSAKSVAKREASHVYVALLRGINVGGNNLVSMKSLKDNFEQLGFTGVKTYINSGNVIFRSPETDARALEDTIDRMLERSYKVKGRTVVRTKREIARVVRTLEREPPLQAEWKCNVVFLRSTIDPKATLKGIPIRSQTERVVCCPGTWLWFVSAQGFSSSAMMKVGRSPLYREMTVRNPNTTRAVLALMEAADLRSPAPRGHSHGRGRAGVPR
jgi:uncharacterized protein (DUF1697 family)